MLNTLDLCSGIGGFRSGLEPLNCFRFVGHCEIDEKTERAYRALYNTEGDYFCSDIRKIYPRDLPPIDLDCAGFPCQTFSVAGQRMGFRDDTRGSIFFEVARIVAEKRPRILLLENVPGLLSHDQGRTFETVLATLTELGYAVEWCVHNSAFFGVPQQRRRIYIVGHLDPKRCGKVFPIESVGGETLKELVSGSMGSRVYDPNGTACTQCATAGGGGAKTGLYLVDLNPDPVMTTTARCLVARYDKGISNHRGECSGVLDETMPPIVRIRDENGVYHQGSIRRLTPQECWRLQGFTDEQFAKVQALGMSDAVLYKMAGNAVSVPVIRAIGEKIMKIYKEEKNA